MEDLITGWALVYDSDRGRHFIFHKEHYMLRGSKNLTLVQEFIEYKDALELIFQYDLITEIQEN